MPGVEALGTRISVVGDSGAGKSMFAAALADRLGLRHVELDSIYHQPGWQALSTGAFLHRTRQALGAGDWVVDGNYSPVVRGLVWPRAESVVWLDYPLPLVTSRLVARTVRRARTGEAICNGNYETWSNLWRHGGVVRWSAEGHYRRRRRYQAASEDPAWSHLTFVRLTSPAAADRLLRS